VGLPNKHDALSSIPNTEKKGFKEMYWEWAIVVHTCNASTQEDEQKDCRFEASTEIIGELGDPDSSSFFPHPRICIGKLWEAFFSRYI
jgi:hypothetical protein